LTGSTRQRAPLERECPPLLAIDIDLDAVRSDLLDRELDGSRDGEDASPSRRVQLAERRSERDRGAPADRLQIRAEYRHRELVRLVCFRIVEAQLQDERDG
jgi:hypothetical protein